RAQLESQRAVRRVLDFGCGIGDTTRHLAETFERAEVVGVDLAATALSWARERHGSSRIRFERLDEFSDPGTFDLCYVTGVFHHIEPSRRRAVVADLHAPLRPA